MIFVMNSVQEDIPTSTSKPKKKYHQTLTEKLLSLIKQCMQIEKPTKTNPHTNAYQLNTKTQFPSFQNR